MLKIYLVTYDIREARRLRAVHKKMLGYGDPLQDSVFRCELTEANKVRMATALGEIVKKDEDSVLIFDLGPAEGARAGMVEALGEPYAAGDHDAVVV